uniref:Uncharacterized protein n=1 Tax=Nelumbo nucifera TaxID=4432 RepID=A0A822ZRX9_NELNU|nr:TPA_asm: hypothetical protein HUJ06_017168 [Nelumbo nucifera]
MQREPLQRGEEHAKMEKYKAVVYFFTKLSKCRPCSHV